MEQSLRSFAYAPTVGSTNILFVSEVFCQKYFRLSAYFWLYFLDKIMPLQDYSIPNHSLTFMSKVFRYNLFGSPAPENVGYDENKGGLKSYAEQENYREGIIHSICSGLFIIG